MEKAGLCAGGCCGAPGVGRGEDDAKQAAQHRGQQYTAQTVFSRWGSFRSAVLHSHNDVVTIYDVYTFWFNVCFSVNKSNLILF